MTFPIGNLASVQTWWLHKQSQNTCLVISKCKRDVQVAKDLNTDVDDENFVSDSSSNQESDRDGSEGRDIWQYSWWDNHTSIAAAQLQGFYILGKTV